MVRRKKLRAGAGNMSERVKICAAAEVPADGAKCVTLGEREFAVIARGGKFYAVENCSAQGRAARPRSGKERNHHLSVASLPL